MNQCAEIVPEVRRQQAFDGRPNQIYNRVQISRLILYRSLQLPQRRFDGAALRVAQYHHQACAELLGGKLDTADEGRGNDFAGDPNDEQISQSLIENDFNRHPGIGTSKDGRKWFLTRGQLEATRPTRNCVTVADVRHETAVPGLQKRESFPSQDHR